MGFGLKNWGVMFRFWEKWSNCAERRCEGCQPPFYTFPHHNHNSIFHTFYLDNWNYPIANPCCANYLKSLDLAALMLYCNPCHHQLCVMPFTMISNVYFIFSRSTNYRVFFLTLGIFPNMGGGDLLNSQNLVLSLIKFTPKQKRSPIFLLPKGLGGGKIIL